MKPKAEVLCLGYYVVLLQNPEETVQIFGIMILASEHCIRYNIRRLTIRKLTMNLQIVVTKWKKAN
jgi:hypothetical protein